MLQRIIGFMVLAMCMGLSLHAQTKVSIKGVLTDDAGEPLGGASLMLLQAKDSILQSFSLSGPDGKFQFNDVPAGDYVFKSMLLKHNTLVQLVKVDGQSGQMDLGTLKMTPESAKIDEVQITDERQPIRMKGDTIEYDAKAFTTQQGDNVENLLKKMPGMEVDNDGNIKAQGKNVVKVLVDGKEFFGDDPKMASKNLPAGAVDKVQVFDKRSEMADFTGVDDGTRDRTINLTLKEEYKKGYFGNVMAGYGTKNRFEGKATLSRYADKSQLTFIGQANNTNQQGFSMQDYMSFMGGMQNMSRESMSGMQTSMNLGVNLNSGFYTTGAGGLSGNWDIGKKTKINASYFYNAMRKDLDRFASKQTILDEGSYLTTEDGTQVDLNQNHRLAFSLKQDIDSLTKLTIRATGSLNNTVSDIANITSSEINGGASNSSDQSSNTVGNLNNLQTNLNLMHRFVKRGRSMNFTGTFRLNPQDKEIDLRSVNAFAASDTVPTFTDTLRQNQQQTQGLLNYSGALTYSEPLGKRSVLDASLNYQSTVNKLDKNFFNLDQEGNNPVLNPTLSNAYESVFSYGKAGLNWRFFTKASNLNVGAAFQRSILDGTILTTNTPIFKTFDNFLPSLEYRLTLSKNQRFDVRYNARVNEPSITQLQPVPDNSNPLNISVGNPDLRAEYAHVMRANYSLFDQFSFMSLFVGLTGTYTQHKISSLTVVDSLLRQVTMPVNVDNDLNLGTNINFSTPIRKLQMKVAVNGNASYWRSIVFINGVENFVNRTTVGGDLRLENKKKDHFDASIGGRTSYTISQYPTSSNLNQSYLNSGLFGEAYVFLPKRITVMSGIDCSIYTGGGFNSQQVVPLWRAYVSKKVFKNGRGEFKVMAYDLLNRNVGITRTAQLNYQQEEQVNTLSRYFLGSFTYQIVAIGKK